MRFAAFFLYLVVFLLKTGMPAHAAHVPGKKISPQQILIDLNVTEDEDQSVLEEATDDDADLYAKAYAGNDSTSFDSILAYFHHCYKAPAPFIGQPVDRCIVQRVLRI
ncbi:MAG: hypothetical protein J0G98_19215 [Terrimonas ferruginea]|jgi:hypothetical protein|uniref:hypothetical protein n=1 Tax=Terrimonas ferruginea TaxID=249 RepID=UPI000AF53532|nr:hypothetical protein [Terrimonas ferruginea]MBN8785199.1 hypothetical protein [Terrimonas ferruginea]